MIEGQTTIFDVMYQKFKIDKPIKTIELFGGYGSQLLSLKYIGANVEQWKLCEWAVKSIQAYKDIHFPDDDTDYSKDISLEDLIEKLYSLGISSNYNEPMTKEQIKRLNEKQVRTIYNNIKATHNLVNIQSIHADDLEIKDKDKYCYIMTYSFPCQDLSLAGKGKGMSDTSTRSGLLWEVERLLSECQELPQVLLMENVPMIHSVENIDDFNKWKLRLEEFGYKNYFQDLTATDYGIPQTRNRTFMVSLLGDYSFTFPAPIPLRLKLKDLLETNVSEKYYLSDRMMDYIISNDNDKYKVNPSNLVINREIVCSKSTREGCSRADTSDYVCDNLPSNFNSSLDNYLGVIDSYNKKETNPDYSGTIVAGQGRNQGSMIMIKNNTQKGYLEAYEGDGINIQGRMEYQRGNVQSGISQTLNTYGGNNVGVVVSNDVCTTPQVLGGIGEKDSNNNTQWKQQNRIYNDNVSISVTTSYNPYYKNNLRIRKLTPYECFALMGVKKEDYEKVKKNQSDSSLYHLAGDSIVVNVLMAIFKEML